MKRKKKGMYNVYLYNNEEYTTEKNYITIIASASP